MAEVITTFVNVDLDIKSPTDLKDLTAAFARKTTAIHSGRSGRRHWVRLELLRQPRTPDEGIKRFADLALSLRGTAREAWDNGTKEFDIGIEAGSEPNPAEWVIGSRTLQAAASVGAELRITVYSPTDVIQKKNLRKRAG